MSLNQSDFYRNKNGRVSIKLTLADYHELLEDSEELAIDFRENIIFDLLRSCDRYTADRVLPRLEIEVLEIRKRRLSEEEICLTIYYGYLLPIVFDCFNFASS